MSGVDPAVLQALELTPTGEADIHTPSTGGTPVHAATYDVRVGILTARMDDSHFVPDTLQVMAIGLDAHGFQALIGPDVLSKCILHFHGADSFFTLAY